LGLQGHQWQALTEKSLHTAVGNSLAKPAYMAPEQAEMSGLDVDTSGHLQPGILLYQLLTGQTPFDPGRLAKAGLAGIPRIIREEEPPRPSTKLTT